MPTHSSNSYAMLCYAMLRYAMLCYTTLCYAMLCYAMLCYVTVVSNAETRVMKGGREWGDEWVGP